MLPVEAVLCSHYAQLCNGIFLTQGLGQATCQIMAVCSCKSFTSENLPLCIMQFYDNYKYFGYLKGANEVNREYFQQAVHLLLCLLRALYYIRWNMLLCCMYHNIIMPKIMLA